MLYRLTTFKIVFFKFAHSIYIILDIPNFSSKLRKTHQSNDRAVIRAYGMNVVTTIEINSVAKLFTLYTHLSK
ncbi:hypothetical protein EFQ39_05040 [Limosilactobacillus fermentum]|nr:hypothetical protein [Limosilactobacillus fermentum]